MALPPCSTIRAMFLENSSRSKELFWPGSEGAFTLAPQLAVPASPARLPLTWALTMNAARRTGDWRFLDGLGTKSYRRDLSPQTLLWPSYRNIFQGIQSLERRFDWLGGYRPARTLRI